jgi:hypothetical protein
VGKNCINNLLNLSTERWSWYSMCSSYTMLLCTISEPVNVVNSWRYTVIALFRLLVWVRIGLILLKIKFDFLLVWNIDGTNGHTIRSILDLYILIEIAFYHKYYHLWAIIIAT